MQPGPNALTAPLLFVSAHFVLVRCCQRCSSVPRWNIDAGGDDLRGHASEAGGARSLGVIVLISMAISLIYVKLGCGEQWSW